MQRRLCPERQQRGAATCRTQQFCQAYARVLHIQVICSQPEQLKVCGANSTATLWRLHVLLLLIHRLGVQDCLAVHRCCIATEDLSSTCCGWLVVPAANTGSSGRRLGMRQRNIHLIVLCCSHSQGVEYGRTARCGNQSRGCMHTAEAQVPTAGTCHTFSSSTEVQLISGAHCRYESQESTGSYFKHSTKTGQTTKAPYGKCTECNSSCADKEHEQTTPHQRKSPRARRQSRSSLGVTSSTCPASSW